MTTDKLLQESINKLVQDCYNNSQDKGFYELDVYGYSGELIPSWKDHWSLVRLNVSEKLCLIHSEVSEALEDLRKIRSYDDISNPEIKETGLLKKPTGFGSELADIVIRVFDLAGWLGIDLGSEILRKMEYNKSRSHKHGKEF